VLRPQDLLADRHCSTKEGFSRVVVSLSEEKRSQVIEAIGCVLVLGPQMLTLVAGSAFYSALFAPFRSVGRFFRSLLYIPGSSASFIVRKKGWTLLQQLAFGLEGYRYPIPPPELVPSEAPAEVIKYEDLPPRAVERALDNRTNWFVRNFGDISQMLAKMALTASDISFLQRLIETDTLLVHGSYYSDDEVIGRIADWIGGSKQMPLTAETDLMH
jgi:hypothetical protein